MATVTYIILPSVVKERMSLHDNVDDKLIYPEIKAVQDLYIMPLLGSTLYNKILTDIADGTLAGDYKDLMDNYLIMAICNYVMSELPEGLNYQFWNKGVSQKTVDNATQPSMSEMYSIVAKYKSRAEHYVNRARMYLIEYGNEKFPEYVTFVAGVDTVYPDRTSYSIPIYLGNETEVPPDDYSLNKRPPAGYNSNDPFYI
tara:strand:+ start:4402 stop:5001 length:600 start_codon:yes stop_codon:yes gene_type:complete